MGIMLVYDVTNEKSFENIKNWIRNIEENASADVEKMILGNKCDLDAKRQVNNTVTKVKILSTTVKLINVYIVILMLFFSFRFISLF